MTTPVGFVQQFSTSSAIPVAQGCSYISALTIVAVGSGYNLGDIGTVNGGSGLSAQYKVTAVNALGQVLAVGINLNKNGCYSGYISGTLSTTPLSGSGSGLTVTPTIVTNLPPPAADICTITCQTQGIMWRDDGVNPTPTVGNPIPVNLPTTITPNMANLKIIAQAAGAIANIEFLTHP